jgi:SAM-dependent methyltransferase
MDESLYDQHYGHMEDPVYREIRAETWGQDLGQTSWLTAGELQDFIQRLDLSASDRVLEVACGTGGAAVLMAHETGAHVVGVDVSTAAIAAASRRAAAEFGGDRVEFREVDADRPLPFEDEAFTAIFCNDAINHLADRRAVLGEFRRLLAPGGRLLYTDPVVVTGPISADEIAARSSIGPFLFLPRGENEMILGECGFVEVASVDATDNLITVSRRWREARAWRRDSLIVLEGEDAFLATQRFLNIVHGLAKEGRLSRHAFRALRPGSGS